MIPLSTSGQCIVDVGPGSVGYAAWDFRVASSSDLRADSRAAGKRFTSIRATILGGGIDCSNCLTGMVGGGVCCNCLTGNEHSRALMRKASCRSCSSSRSPL